MKELSDCTMLVADDTEANVDILVDALGELYDVSVAMDGREAVETVAEEAPDLILFGHHDARDGRVRGLPNFKGR